jgi:hypothetical protein
MDGLLEDSERGSREHRKEYNVYKPFVESRKLVSPAYS